MKSIQELLSQPPVYLHRWGSKIDLISDFEDLYMSEKDYNANESTWPNKDMWYELKDKMKAAIESETWQSSNILFASYGTDNYSGDAFVLYENGGRLYEVNGSHCSCYGLEGKWKPEETTLEAISHRLTSGTMGTDSYSDNEFAKELKAFIGID
jgi:hypothetical protein